MIQQDFAALGGSGAGVGGFNTLPSPFPTGPVSGQQAPVPYITNLTTPNGVSGTGAVGAPAAPGSNAGVTPQAVPLATPVPGPADQTPAPATPAPAPADQAPIPATPAPAPATPADQAPAPAPAPPAPADQTQPPAPGRKASWTQCLRHPRLTPASRSPRHPAHRWWPRRIPPP